MGNKKHTQNLEKTALLIFDSMKKYHGMGKRERLLLRISAILQDCGKFVSLSNSADCAYNIIMSTEIIGLSHKEREIVANVVRYNTTGYDYEHAMRHNGDGISALITAKLVAILMIVNGMDRSYKQKFDSIRCVLKDHKLMITTDSTEDITLEQSLFQTKADFFEEVYGIRPVLKKKRI
jgi:exopolyphosphatase/guanosine-5'-triphosphate,3'-diphosphate pyrophosphatase